MQRPNFAFITDIEFEKLPLFCFSCKMISHDISKCRRYSDNLNSTTKTPTIVSKPIVVQYKHVIVQTKEINDAPHKEVVGVTKKKELCGRGTNI